MQSGDLAGGPAAAFAVGLVGSWVMTGLCLVLFQAGVQKTDTSLDEAARIDGAGAVREFFAVALPGPRSEISVSVTVTVIAAPAGFDGVHVTTRGEVGTACAQRRPRPWSL
ncbi:ABC transporter permease subunit [Streptomyces sp. NPDC094144]|uniref:ABC transporter permease subunit n=1 Tax=Streptomyces sp. NPDC094144 TaxID=3366056 RepID=UPI003801AC69